MKRYFLLFLAILSMTSCNKEGEILNITDNCKFDNIILSPCFSGLFGSEYDEIVFRNNQQYQTFGNSVRVQVDIMNCDTAQIPEIDFEKFTLLSKRTCGGGCGVKSHEPTVHKDTKNKKIIYKISIEYIGECYMLICSQNWALVPKIPNNYTVEFQINEKPVR